MQTPWGNAPARMPLLRCTYHRMQQHCQHRPQARAWQQEASNAQTLPAAPNIAWQWTSHSPPSISPTPLHVRVTCTARHKLVTPHAQRDATPPCCTARAATSTWHQHDPSAGSLPSLLTAASRLGHHSNQVLVGSRHPLEGLRGLRHLALVRVQQAGQLLVALLHQGAPGASRHLRG